MKAVLRVKKINRDRHVETGEEFFDVVVQLIDPDDIPEMITVEENGEKKQVKNEEGKTKPRLIEVRRLSFPIKSSEKQIKQELKKYIDNYNAELKLAEEREAQDKADAQATQTIESLSGGVFE